MLNNSKDRGQEGQGIDAYFASFQGPQSPKLELIKETSADLKLTQAFQDSQLLFPKDRPLSSFMYQSAVPQSSARQSYYVNAQKHSL